MGHYEHEREVLTKGESIYLDTLKDELEKKHLGWYVAIDVDSRDYLVNASRVTLIEEARRRFGEKVFFITQIGNLFEPTINFRERPNVEWLFS